MRLGPINLESDADIAVRANHLAVCLICQAVDERWASSFHFAFSWHKGIDADYEALKSRRQVLKPARLGGEGVFQAEQFLAAEFIGIKVLLSNHRILLGSPTCGAKRTNHQSMGAMYASNVTLV